MKSISLYKSKNQKDSFCSKILEFIFIKCKLIMMNSISVTNLPQSGKNNILDDWESAVIDLFLNAAISFGLPKSYGQIYGLLFCRDKPLAMDEVMNLLQISKGSASQGLRALRQLGAVSSSFAPGDRRERFAAEIRLRKLVSGFLREQADPHLHKGGFAPSSKSRIC